MNMIEKCFRKEEDEGLGVAEVAGVGVVEVAQVADQEPTPFTVEHWKLVTYWLPVQ